MELCLAGDVMLGRGIDQIQRHPGEPSIHEPWMTSATGYVELAEQVSGPIPRAVDPGYVWGEALDLPTETRPTTIVNLETAVTDRGRPWPGKGIQYRMHPAAIDTLTVAPIHVVSLANNHVLDWSEPGLLQTLETLEAAGVQFTGAGRDLDHAWHPVRVRTPRGGVLVLGVGTTDSGIPSNWAATPDRPGVAWLPDLSDRTLDHIARTVDEHKASGDIVVVSIHWGENWGYRISRARRDFAHGLIEAAGVDVVHGHSSHHPVGIEVHRERLILYGCGDLITDYEGIRGHERFRGELGALYLPTLEDQTGRLLELRVVPTRMHRFRLETPTPHDVRWLAGTLDEQGEPLGTRAEVRADGLIGVRWERRDLSTEY